MPGFWHIVSLLSWFVNKFKNYIAYIAVFVLTHFPEAWDKSNWIQTSENYERICLNTIEKFSTFNFRASRWKKWRQRLYYRKICCDPGENHGPSIFTSPWQTLSHKVVSGSHFDMNGNQTYNLSGDISTDCISRCKSNYTYTCTFV